jgi:hypothetical protein
MDDGTMIPGDLRCGIVALARSDRRLMEATLRSIARLADAPDAAALVVPALSAHQFADAATNPTFPSALRVVASESFDTLPLADGLRAMAPRVDIIVFVPEGVVLGPDYLRGVRETAACWQDMVGELDLVDRVADDESLAHGFSTADGPEVPSGSRLLRALRAKTLCANVLWVRVEACGNLKFMAFPQTAEYLAFSSLLDQLRPRGRTRMVASGGAVQVRSGPERRSGFEAGRELYGALSRIGEWRDRSDVVFQGRPSYLEPRAEKLRLFGEQILRYVGSPASRSHTGSFIKGMWAARREAATTRHRIRDDIRNLG